MFFIPKVQLPYRLLTISLVSLMALSGCSTGPYSPPDKLPDDKTVVETPHETSPAPSHEDEEKREEPRNPTPEPEPVDLSIGPRDAERGIDLSVDGPILIPREVFEE